MDVCSLCGDTGCLLEDPCPLCTDDDSSKNCSKQSSLLKLPPATSIADLPASPASKLCLVLDIDGTMLSESISPDCTAGEMRSFLRPHLDEFLDFVFESCGAVGIWTAASDAWLKLFLHAVDPVGKRKWAFKWSGRKTSYRLESIDCLFPTRYKVKKLAKIWNNNALRSLGYNRRSTLIIDNTPTVCDCNYGNAIYVSTYGEEWMTDSTDDCLLMLTAYLETLTARFAQGISMRVLEKRGWYNNTKSGFVPE